MGPRSETLLGNRRLLGTIAVVVAAGAIAGFLWFRPDKLFTDDVVNDKIPETRAADEAGAGEGPTHSLAEGEFVGHSRYTTKGRALVLELDNGGRIVRFEDFETSNGPDLRVYLSAAGSGAEGRALAEDFIDLGPLRGNVGDQNYEIPDGADLERYSTVVIWCVRFTVSFGAAELHLG